MFLSNGKGYAQRDNVVREEITRDYACLDDAPTIDSSIKCQCGSSNCLKIFGTTHIKIHNGKKKDKHGCSAYISKKIQQLSLKQNI